MMWLLLVILARHVTGSPTMCHCANGQVGITCPQPIQMSCPTMHCPAPHPCHTFPTLGPITMPPGGIQGIPQFTLPTLPPFPASAFGPAPAPIPLPVAPATNGQDSQPSLQSSQYTNAQQQQQYQAAAPAAPAIQAPPPPPPIEVATGQALQQQQQQVNIQAPSRFAEPIVVDLTTKATPSLPSESYVEADSPENHPADDLNDKLSLYENQPNRNSFFDGFRQPARRALAPSATKPEIFTDKCNDDRLKKLIEDNIDTDPTSSKRKIQKAATKEIGGLFDVICSSHDFSYLANTQLFCEAGNEYVTCFAFLHSLIQ